MSLWNVLKDYDEIKNGIIASFFIAICNPN